MRKAKLPLNADAVKRADEALYEKHPELDGRKLTTGDEDASLRKEWMDSYLANGGEAASAGVSSPLGESMVACEFAVDSSPASTGGGDAAADEKEAARRRALGTDPASGRYRKGEEEAALRLERKTGRLRRDPTGTGDWLDLTGRSYDAVGPVPAGRFHHDSFARQIDRHLLKQGLDFVVVDVAGLSPSEQASVLSHVAGLPPAQRARIITQP